MVYLVSTREITSDGTCSPESEKSFRILAIYDSHESRRQAARALAVVLRELDDDVIVHRYSWDTNALQKAEAVDRAAAEAAQADVIVIAVADREPSDMLKDWTAGWQRKRELSSGLLALIPCNETRTGGDLAEFLYETAVGANMDFLCRKPRRF